MPSIFTSAPTSPNGTSPDGVQFYSAPSSPSKESTADARDDLSSSFDNFEFETSKKFVHEFMDFDDQMSYNSESLLEVQQKKHENMPKRERGGSLPTMAFADELFYNGQVMPLKPPPPRHCSIPSSPKSPRSPTSVFKVPFMRRATAAAWNDNFDPFKVALEKVSDEYRGRSSNAGSNHRRRRSHSPFRTNNSQSCDYSEMPKNRVGENLERRQTLGLNSFQHKRERSKGSFYARWVHDQTKQMDQMMSPKGKNMLKALSFGGRIRPVKNYHEGYIKTTTSSEDVERDEKIDVVVETKVKGIRGILLRYTMFGRDHSDQGKSKGKVPIKWKSSYFNKLSFKTPKGSGSGNGRRRVIEESKMAVIECKRNKANLGGPLLLWSSKSKIDTK